MSINHLCFYFDHTTSKHNQNKCSAESTFQNQNEENAEILFFFFHEKQFSINFFFVC